jgi:tetratricopeptide (TPR) repeat protein
MRLALVIAPSDPRSGDSGLRREALAWLRGRLARFGFHVIIVGGTQDPQADIERATERVSAGDTVLVHVSGRLAGRDAVAFGDSGTLSLGALTAAIASRSPAYVSFVLELTHEEEPDDALLAAGILGAAVSSLGAKPRGYPVLAALRPLGMAVDRLAFTRLALPAASEHEGPPPTETLVATMYEAASANSEKHTVAQSLTFSRGGLSIPPPADPAAEGYAYQPAPPAVEAGAVADSLPAQGSGADDSGLSIHSQIAEATELRDWARALELRRHRLHMLASPRQKGRELVAIARILQAEFGDADGAIEALEMARAMEARPVNVLLALRRGYERLGRWTQLLEVMGALAGFTESPVERAAIQLARARIAFERLGDIDRAVEWLAAAVADDPTNSEAASALRHFRPDLHVPAFHTASGPPASAVPPPVALPPPAPLSVALPPSAPPPVAVAPPLAAAAPAIALPPAPAEPVVETLEAREKRAERLLAEGADDDALVELEAIAAKAPTRVSIYEKVFTVHRRAGRTDASFLAALALEELDAADVDQQVLIEQFRSVGPVRVRASLDDAAWKALRAPGADDVLTALFAAIEPAAIAARVEELRDSRALVMLDSADRLSEASTASIVRSFQWAARVLSIACPSLYLRDDVPTGIAAIHAREPSTGLGPSVLSGPSAKDLAFLAGRHLTYYRPGHQVVLYYPERDELTMLLLAAAQLAMPQVAAQSSDAAVHALRGRLGRHLGSDDRLALQKAVRALDARGGQAALGAWMSSVELTAARTGMVLCGDLATATALIRSESRTVANLSVDVRRDDLVAFCASRAHAAMRVRFAMTAPDSVHPPPPPSSNSLQLGP